MASTVTHSSESRRDGPSSNGGPSSYPSTQSLLESIDRRLRRLESSLGPVVRAANSAPQVVASYNGVAAGDAEEYFDARVRALVGIFERLSRPQTQRLLRRVLDRAEQVLALGAAFADGFEALLKSASRRGLRGIAHPPILENESGSERVQAEPSASAWASGVPGGLYLG